MKNLLSLLVLFFFLVNNLISQQQVLCDICDNGVVNGPNFGCEPGRFRVSSVENFTNKQCDIFIQAQFTGGVFFTNSRFTVFKIENGVETQIYSEPGLFHHVISNNINGGTYRVRHCFMSPTIGLQSCCRVFTFPPLADNCCELRMRFRSEFPAIWTFGEGMTEASTSQNFNNFLDYTYRNVNTYQVNTLPISLNLSPGNWTNLTQVPFPQVYPVIAPQGIWIGTQCSVSDISTLKNSISPTQQLVLPGILVSGKQISVDGNLRITKQFKFDNCDICMNPNAKIQVATSSEVFYNYTKVHEAACRARSWFGIETVTSGANVKAIGSTFEGAFNAFKTNTKTTGMTTFHMERNIFKRNYIGINVNTRATFNTFNGNVFGDETAMLPYPTHNATCWVTTIGKRTDLPTPFAGIYVKSSSGPLTNFGVNLPSTGQVNTFANLANGIYMEGANGNIKNCKFVSMLCNTGYINDVDLDDGYGIFFNTNKGDQLTQFGLGKTSAATFTKCRHAINVGISNVNSQIQCSNNNMESVQNGISINAKQSGGFLPNSLLTNNNISYGSMCNNIPDNHGIWVFIDKQNTSILNITKTRITTDNPTGLGIWLQSSGAISGITDKVAIVGNTGADGIYNGENGIRLNNFSNALIEDNNIENFVFSGIHSVNATKNRLRCNVVHSNVGGFASIFTQSSPANDFRYNHTSESVVGLDFNGASDNASITCNTFDKHKSGIYYEANTLVGLQNQSESSNGNVWTNNAIDASCDGMADPNNAYFYRNGEIDPSLILPLVGWFNLVSKGITCEKGCPMDEFVGDIKTEMDKSIAEQSVEATGLQLALLNRHLYVKLLQNPTLATGAEMQGFYENYGENNGGKIVTVESNLYNGYKLMTDEQNVMNDAIGSLSTLWQNWQTLDDVLFLADVNEVPAPNQENERAALIASADVYLQIMSSIYAHNLEERINHSDGIRATIENLSVNEIWEINDKTLDLIFVNSLFIDKKPTEVQLADMKAIAKQCSKEGGAAVTRARALYYDLTGLLVFGDCQGVAERDFSHPESSKIREMPTLNISPNPVDGKMSVQFPEDVTSVERIEIYNLADGKRVQIINLAKEAKSISIETANRTNGAYSCKLFGVGRILAVSNFIIQH
jgi:hypothetical protein